MEDAAIFWFRNDLRISDNPGLFQAARSKRIFLIYILDEEDEKFKLGGASKVWLYHSLHSLNKSLSGKLNIYKGDSLSIIDKLVNEKNIKSVHWNRRYWAEQINKDSQIKSLLNDKGINAESYNGSLLFEPWEVLKDDKSYYKVFTPFYRRGYQSSFPREVLDSPELSWLVKDSSSLTIEQLELLPKKDWHISLMKGCKVGEQVAQNKLFEFLDNNILNYDNERNYPYLNSSSMLSPHLCFGEISPNQVWHATKLKEEMHKNNPGIENFLKEISWREFSYYLLYHFKDLPSKNFNEKFNNFAWVDNNDKLFEKWKRGLTGHPLIDAGMRQLWQTGYMHNRIRMVVGSFLVKNLGIHWHKGQDWFWDCLFDADMASNSFNWQWVAGCGADAAPYFRIFNPITQGEKFDPEGIYTRKFVPELKKLPNKFIFRPWEAPSNILKEAGVILGENYPYPIVDINESRNEALRAYKNLNL